MKKKDQDAFSYYMNSLKEHFATAAAAEMKSKERCAGHKPRKIPTEDGETPTGGQIDL